MPTEAGETTHGRQVGIHRLRPNDSVWTPPAVVFFDTETEAREENDHEVHELRLWVAERVDRRNIRKTKPANEWAQGDNARSFGTWLDVQAVGRPSLWAYAHNLNFDLATTRLPIVMADLGWEVRDFSVRGGAPFLRLHKGSKSLTVADSWSWLPQALGTIGKAVNIDKLALPADWEDKDQWAARCAGDVSILSTAILELMAWWDAEQRGHWTITGAGCGWNAMRHIPTVPRHVIDPDETKVAQDRGAVRGGRKDSQRSGLLSGGPWVELDFKGAYPTVAATLPLPWRRGPMVEAGQLDEKWLISQRWGAVAEVVVEVDRPIYPVKWRGVSWHPIGRFRTVLAKPELDSARSAGHVVSVGAAQLHALGYTLQPWGQWVTAVVDERHQGVPRVVQLAAKGWGRSVIGKFAARGHSRTELPLATTQGWSIDDAYDHATGRPGAIVQMAGRRWNVTYEGPSDNAYPAVLAFVESHVRARLGAVLDLLGDAWVSCDTDGVIVDTRYLGADGSVYPEATPAPPNDPIGAAEAFCSRLGDLTAPLTLRPKRLFTSLDIRGPQHMVAGEERRYSGLSARALETQPGHFKSRDWPKLKWQIQHGDEAGYVRPDREQTFTRPLVHRWVTLDGVCLPPEMRIDASGENEIVPWSETSHARSGATLAPLQYHGLHGLY